MEHHYATLGNIPKISVRCSPAIAALIQVLNLSHNVRTINNHLRSGGERS